MVRPPTTARNHPPQSILSIKEESNVDPSNQIVSSNNNPRQTSSQPVEEAKEQSQETPAQGASSSFQQFLTRDSSQRNIKLLKRNSENMKTPFTGKNKDAKSLIDNDKSFVNMEIEISDSNSSDDNKLASKAKEFDLQGLKIC